MKRTNKTPPTRHGESFVARHSQSEGKILKDVSETEKERSYTNSHSGVKQMKRDSLTDAKELYRHPQTDIKEIYRNSQTDVKEIYRNSQTYVKELYRNSQTHVKQPYRNSQTDVKQQDRNSRTDVKQQNRNSRTDVKQQNRNSRTDVKQPHRKPLADVTPSFNKERDTKHDSEKDSTVDNHGCQDGDSGLEIRTNCESDALPTTPLTPVSGQASKGMKENVNDLEKRVATLESRVGHLETAGRTEKTRDLQDNMNGLEKRIGALERKTEISNDSQGEMEEVVMRQSPRRRLKSSELRGLRVKECTDFLFEYAGDDRAIKEARRRGVVIHSYNNGEFT